MRLCQFIGACLVVLALPLSAARAQPSSIGSEAAGPPPDGLDLRHRPRRRDGAVVRGRCLLSRPAGPQPRSSLSARHVLHVGTRWRRRHAARCRRLQGGTDPALPISAQRVGRSRSVRHGQRALHRRGWRLPALRPAVPFRQGRAAARTGRQQRACLRRIARRQATAQPTTSSCPAGRACR